MHTIDGLQVRRENAVWGAQRDGIRPKEELDGTGKLAGYIQCIFLAVEIVQQQGMLGRGRAEPD